MAGPLKIVLGEDHQVLREGLRALLAADEGLEVVAEAADGREAVELALRHAADLVVLDVGMPVMNGIDAALELARRGSTAGIIVLSMYDDENTVARALRAGVRGYVLKGEGIGQLREAIRVVARGGAYLSPGVAGHVTRGALRPGARAGEVLSAREVEVLRLIAGGRTCREVAAELGLAPKTVENHRTHIMEKLDIHTTAGLVRYAFQHGLVR